MRNYLLVLWVIVFFLVVGCATPEPRVKVLEKPVYVEKPKRVDVNTVISQLSHQISSTMLEQNKRRVAVMHFFLVTGEMTELGLYLSDKLTNSLFQYRDKFEVIERTRLESVLKEIKLGFTGIIDDKTAQSIGKILGADSIVIGTITDLGEEVDINIRMLGTERANVLAVASTQLEKSDAIVKLMANVRITEPGTVEKAPQPKVMSKVEINDFIFEARECRRSGEKVMCSIAVTNITKTSRELYIFTSWRQHALATYRKSFLIDDLGNQYAPEGGQFADFDTTGKMLHLQPNLPIAVSLTYTGVASVAKYVNMIVDCESEKYQFKAVLRNIPLTR